MSHMPKPRPMTPEQARDAERRMVNRLVAEGYQSKPAIKASAPKPTGGVR